MQQLDTGINTNAATHGTVRYGFQNIKGAAAVVVLLIAASFISGNQAKKRQVAKQADAVQYDLTKFEKHIQDSKQLLKKNRP